ncbi:sialic acid-binding Ig-like lectin 15, partial [Pristis pectinata]|uniref:sialic acid-binding Ig-like lectin 15 n=1 Tax=Pristis pectinata TaxID=685728 RepID=UPI00223E2A0F
MYSLRICLCAVLLSVSVQGYNYSFNGWSLSGADEVSAVEGDSAVLPCTFTHPPSDLALTGSVIWFRRKRESDADISVFTCTYPDPGPTRCDGATQAAGRGR